MRLGCPYLVFGAPVPASRGSIDRDILRLQPDLRDVKQKNSLTNLLPKKHVVVDDESEIQVRARTLPCCQTFAYCTLTRSPLSRPSMGDIAP